MSRKFFAHRFEIVAILLMLTAAAFAAAVHFKSPVSAQAAQPADEGPYKDLLAPQSWVWRSCVISDIFASESRIHVRCTTASPANIFYFAINGDSAHQNFANRALVLLNTAYALNKPVWVAYDTETSANPPGCQTGDCRALVQILIQP